VAKRRSALRKKAFLDSSVLFTAVNSLSGGSAKLFTLKNLQLTTSPLVLTEVERNVRQKLENYHLKRFFLLVSKLKLTDQRPDLKLTKQATRIIIKKDAAILAEAKKSKANFLLTLDKKHFLTLTARAFAKPQKILTPKMFFEEFF